MSAGDDGSVSEEVRPAGSDGAVDESAGAESEAPAAAVRRRRWPGRLVIAVVVAATLGFGGWYAYREYDRGRNVQSRFTAAADALAALEADLLVVDAAVQEGIASSSPTVTAEALELAPDVAARAREVSSTVAGLMSELPDEYVPLANALKGSAEARAAMMNEAPLILETDLKAAAAIVAADGALARMKSADEEIAKASAEFNRHVKAGVEAATQHSTLAGTHLLEAKSLLATATAAFPEADFSTFVAFVDAKIALVADAKAIDALWLAGKLAESNAKLDAYNAKEAAIMEMAKALPVSVRDPIADAYEQITAGATARYFEARERAQTAGEEAERLQAELDGAED